jgi:Kef-type K+ transport system membrane component KefB
VSIVSSVVVPVLAKLPLGLFVPRFSRDVPEDFPYDPYWRDVSIASLSMLCRGEFNFIVASFGLSSGLLDPNQYAEVVFAILSSCVCAPLILTQVIRYYNGKSRPFLRPTIPSSVLGIPVMVIVLYFGLFKGVHQYIGVSKRSSK